MLDAGNSTPAGFWRALFIFLMACASSLTSVAAPGPTPPELAQLGVPDAADAARLIQQFRQAGIPGQYYLEFELQALPRRGEERVFRGRLWGSRNAQGAVTRVELTDDAGAHRLLIQNGEKAAVWRFVDGHVTQLAVADGFKPLIPGVEVTAFDVQMPFLYWPNPTVEKITRVLGRPTNVFLFRAPPSFLEQSKEIGGARAYLDTQFNQLLQTELIDRRGKVVKSFAFLSLKKVRDQYIPKQADYHNEVTHDKTRLQINAAALQLSLPATLFAPDSLAQPAPLPAAKDIVRLD